MTFRALILLCSVVACVKARGQTIESAVCRAIDLGTRPFTVGRDRLFVEPQAVAVSRDRLLVAGAPSYYWTKRDSEFALTRDSVIAVISDSSGVSTAVRGPLGPERSHDVRAVALNDGRWVVAFAEAAPLVHPYDEPDVEAVWIGILDARGAWRRLERISAFQGRPLSERTSLSARSADEIALAIPVRRNDDVRVTVIVRSGGRWGEATVMTQEAHYTSLVDQGSGRLSLGVVHGDPTGAPDHNSLWLYRSTDAGRSWSPPIRLVRGKGQPVHDPGFSLLQGGQISAVWLTSTARRFEARAATFTRADSANVMSFGEGAVQVFAETQLGKTSLWTTYHQKPSVQLRLWASTSGEPPREVAAVGLPFDGIIGIVRIGELLLGAGPVRGRSPSDPAVSLELQRLVVRCK